MIIRLIYIISVLNPLLYNFQTLNLSNIKFGLNIHMHLHWKKKHESLIGRLNKRKLDTKAISELTH